MIVKTHLSPRLVSPHARHVTCMLSVAGTLDRHPTIAGRYLPCVTPLDGEDICSAAVRFYGARAQVKFRPDEFTGYQIAGFVFDPQALTTRQVVFCSEADLPVLPTMPYYFWQARSPENLEIQNQLGRDCLCARTYQDLREIEAAGWEHIGYVSSNDRRAYGVCYPIYGIKTDPGEGRFFVILMAGKQPIDPELKVYSDAIPIWARYAAGFAIGEFRAPYLIAAQREAVLRLRQHAIFYPPADFYLSYKVCTADKGYGEPGTIVATGGLHDA